MVVVGCEDIEIDGIGVGSESNQSVLGGGRDSEHIEGVLVGSCSAHTAITVVLRGCHCRLSQWVGKVVI